jgi:hypothetical protein
MKTLINKFTLAILISFITLSISAQNTKSIRFENYRNKVEHLVGNSMNTLNTELSAYVDKLSVVFKFHPAVENQSYEVSDVISDLNQVTSDMEGQIRFVPAAYNEKTSSGLDASVELAAITRELESKVKFNPEESICEKSGDNDLEYLTNLMAEQVRFRPEPTVN